MHQCLLYWSETLLEVVNLLWIVLSRCSNTLIVLAKASYWHTSLAFGYGDLSHAHPCFERSLIKETLAETILASNREFTDHSQWKSSSLLNLQKQHYTIHHWVYFHIDLRSLSKPFLHALEYEASHPRRVLGKSYSSDCDVYTTLFSDNGGSSRSF